MSESSLTPPGSDWWSRPIGRDELVWISIAFSWCLVMTFMMLYWYFVGNQNQAGEVYRMSADKFSAKAEEMIKRYQVRTESDLEIPVVKVPPGGDVYFFARQFQFGIIPILKKGETYRFHLTSLDVNHGFSLLPINLNLQLIPGYDYVLKFTPNAAGEYHIVCNEFCGIGHHEMVGKLYVVE
jgi:cytochrome c oxidase subunit 2